MDFVCIILFLGIYYLKPQEWWTALGSIHFVQLTMYASIAALFMRSRSVKLADLFRTPHDWVMLAYFLWVVVSSPTPFDTFRDFLNRLVFYVVIVQTLTSWGRVNRFLGWWSAMIVAVAALALISEYIIDPLGSRDLTHGTMKDRLVLRISTVNNPNALGHTVVPVIPMLYYFCIWKRPLFMKEVGLVTFLIPFVCVYLTFSKGAYLAGAVTLLATLAFGRPKFIQIALVVLTLVGGITAVQMLPRMNELQKTKTDEAIQGRIKAFTYGREYYDTLARGVGQDQFIKSLLRDHNYYKASHSTYVQTGAELGRIGLFLTLLVIWTGARTLLFAKTHTDEQERIRRILFVLLLTFCVSGWMVDFAYRPTFFMFSAAIAAFHRLLYMPEPETSTEEEEEKKHGRAFAWWPAALAPAGPAPAPISTAVAPAPVVAMEKALRKPWLRSEETDEEAEHAPAPGSFWNRIGLVDIAVTALMLLVTERFWVYAIKTF